ncbi:AbrB/MazE/SpoVT family DNA-binding domain-containing protein [Bacillus sp. REN10]|uniref:AbrB/MazE/SpoVT family DNA-binding domain-containing protein n=1 Tax=Bacillus sp. REN10 TaxID=2782541 RepID=UPI00193AE2D8|nr:AbrB/MazE/SpoVT family DNA-binding domain-containing protein [Bacillus sp. REN10]
MKSTGIVRKVDQLGRIVVPKELRKNLSIDIKDAMEIFVDEDKIILRKYKAEQACIITGEVTSENISLFDGKIHLSPNGVELLKKELERINNKP